MERHKTVKGIEVMDQSDRAQTNMPKIHSPFVRREVSGEYVITPEVKQGYEWVFEDDETMAIEKLHGTNVSITMRQGKVYSVFNRTKYVEPYPQYHWHQKINEAILNSIGRGYMKTSEDEVFEDGQYFGEVVGPDFHNDMYQMDENLWIPFQRYAQKHLEYTSWGRHPNNYHAINNWMMNDLFSLFQCEQNNLRYAEATVSDGYSPNSFKKSLQKLRDKTRFGVERDGPWFCEGIMFTHPDGRMAKLRRDMLPDYTMAMHGRKKPVSREAAIRKAIEEVEDKDKLHL